MTGYRVEFSELSRKQLMKLNPYIRTMIIKWVEKNLEGCENPRVHGKGLTANRSGQWRYRVGDFRLICEIQDNRLIILVLTIGDRKSVY